MPPSLDLETPPPKADDAASQAEARADAASRPALAGPARRTARAALAASLLLLGLWVARDFLLALGWAAVIAIALWPAFARCTAVLSSAPPWLLALIFTLVTGCALLVPVGLVAVEIGQEGQAGADWIAHARENGIPEPGWVAGLPLIGAQGSRWWQAHLGNPGGAEELLGSIDQRTVANWTRSFGGEFLHRLLIFFIMLVALFFLFRDGAWLGARLLGHAERALGDPGERLAERMVGAVRGTVNGTVFVAVGEGVLIGLGYWIAGVPHAVLFGALTVAFAMLPMGAWFAFTVAALTLLGHGSPWAAAAVFGWGVAVMLIGDNFVQPRLIGGYVRLPFLWALIGILGGIQTFGLLGLFLGPVVMAALMTIWREWIEGRASPTV